MADINLAPNQFSENFDWRTHNILTPVKTQNPNFRRDRTASFLDALESNFTLKYGGTPKNFLPTDRILNLVRSQSPLASFSLARYEGVRFPDNNLKSWVTLPQDDETALLVAIHSIGPIAVAIEVEFDFESYSGGVYEGDKNIYPSGELNHGVIVVGYGSENNNNYYIVKNSWGKSWGEDGYVKISRNWAIQHGFLKSAGYPIFN
ncbi:TPA: hypothetical protein SAN82_004913 [Pseudomonas putida]|nr:hypothetical protein [Pseudomonas putida]